MMGMLHNAEVSVGCGILARTMVLPPCKREDYDHAAGTSALSNSGPDVGRAGDLSGL